MKTIFTVILILVLLCVPVTCFAQEPNSNEGIPAAFDSDGFSVYSLPEGSWYQIIMEDGSVFFYGNEYLSTDDGMITFMIEQPAELSGLELSDEVLPEYYDMILEDTVSASVDGAPLTEDSRTAGVPSRTLCMRMDMSGEICSFVTNVVIIDGKIFSILYIHPTKDLETMKKEMQIIIDSVQYEGGIKTGGVDHSGAEEAGTETVEFDYPEAAEEQPLEMEVNFMADRDMPTAMWMMDENSRAACTVLLLMDLSMGTDQGVENPPEFEILDNPSYVGSADDLIRVIIPVRGMEKALIMLFDNTQDTASYYYTDWNDAELDVQKEKCTDQFWENTTDALTAYLISVQDAMAGFSDTDE